MAGHAVRKPELPECYGKKGNGSWQIGCVLSETGAGSAKAFIRLFGSIKRIVI